MKRTRKVQIAVGVLGVAAAAVGFALIGNPVQAKANESALFAMETGAAVRAVENEAGIRWETNVNKAWYDSFIAANEGATDISFGTLVTGADNVLTDGAVDVTKLTMETKDATEAKDLPCKVTPDFNKTSTFTYYASIVYTEKDMKDWTPDEKKMAYAAELVARSYVKYTLGGETKYAYATAEDSARCMRAVALAAYEDTSEDALSDAEKAIVDDYFGDPAQTAVDFGGYYETYAPETVPGEYAVAYNGPKKVGEIKAGTLALDDGLTLGDNYTLTLFAADGSYAKTTAFQYVTRTLDDKAEFVSVIHPSSATTLTGYYVMTTDVDVSSGTAWTATAVLNGTLDGGNHKLTGLNFAQGSGIFASVTDETMTTVTTTVKNINIQDAILFRLSGVIIAQTKGNVTVENVYISLGAQKFGERRENYTANAQNAGIVATGANGTYASNDIGTINVSPDYYEYKAGVVYTANGANSKVTVKNSVIYMPEFVAKANGFVTGVMAETTTVDVDDCTFIGGNGRVWGWVYNQGTCTTDNTNVCGAAEAHQLYKEGWAPMQQDAYNANHPYLELNSQNIAAELTKHLTNQVAVLTEDIDATAAGINTNYHTNTKSVFTGVFDGQGHTVENLTATNYTRGLFLCGVLKGSCKNVAFTNVVWGSYDGGIIAYQVDGGYVANVYVEQTETSTNRHSHGAIAYSANGLSMKDVVVYTKDCGKTSTHVTPGFFAVHGSTSSYNIMNNCYYVTYEVNTYFASVEGEISSENLQKQETFFGIQSFKGVNAKAQFDAAVKAEESTVKLNDMLKAWIYPAE